MNAENATDDKGRKHVNIMSDSEKIDELLILARGLTDAMLKFQEMGPAGMMKTFLGSNGKG